MAELWFYHLEKAGADEVLPGLLQKVLERGSRALVVVPDEDAAARLDTHLWTFRDDSFLPHGRDRDPGAPRQPVLISTETRNVNQADMLFCLGGADPGNPDGWGRVILLFEDADEAAKQRARTLWSAMKKTANAVSYWKQTDQGRWEKQG
ncbi:MAG: DNA polymerase III subunit chi [Caulobacterales bacterium]|uniref:DNA polymerase III subunit chi n=1 Tax=Glycocaulis sp. TaxID=1969725 RepID=UPI003F9F299D